LYTLPKADQDMLNDLGYKEKLEAIDKAILVNASFLAQIVADPEIFAHDLDAEEANPAESDPATAPCPDGDIEGRYRFLDSKSRKKILSHSALKDRLSNLIRTRSLSLIPLGILIVMGDYRQNPIRRRHTNHPSLTWISSEVPLSSSFAIGAKRFLSSFPT
jgi:hypothetical protein